MIFTCVKYTCMLTRLTGTELKVVKEFSQKFDFRTRTQSKATEYTVNFLSGGCVLCVLSPHIVQPSLDEVCPKSMSSLTLAISS